MSESELTKKIKRACYDFKPAMKTNLRTIRYAEEVWTPTGIVDVVRFEDYAAKDDSYCDLIHCEEKYVGKDLEAKKMLFGEKIGKCKIPNGIYGCKKCVGCIHNKHSYELGILVTCFEIKISVSDFKSKNGHNFHGNRNYYVVDSQIYDNIKDLVPDDIGIIVYYQKTGSMRIKKECAFKNISEKTKTRLLYDAFKKWVDRFGYEYKYNEKA